MGRTDDHLIEITFSSVAAYGSFLLAEHFGFSGVLATLTAGIMVGNFSALGRFSDKGRDEVMSFWSYIGFVANCLIFLLIGMRLAHHRLADAWLPAVTAIVVVLLSRAASVYGVCGIFLPKSSSNWISPPTRSGLGRVARSFGAGPHSWAPSGDPGGHASRYRRVRRSRLLHRGTGPDNDAFASSHG